MTKASAALLIRVIKSIRSVPIHQDDLYENTCMTCGHDKGLTLTLSKTKAIAEKLYADGFLKEE